MPPTARTGGDFVHRHYSPVALELCPDLHGALAPSVTADVPVQLVGEVAPVQRLDVRPAESKQLQRVGVNNKTAHSLKRAQIPAAYHSRGSKRNAVSCRRVNRQYTGDRRQRSTLDIGHRTADSGFRHKMAARGCIEKRKVGVSVTPRASSWRTHLWALENAVAGEADMVGGVVWGAQRPALTSRWMAGRRRRGSGQARPAFGGSGEMGVALPDLSASHRTGEGQ